MTFEQTIQELYASIAAIEEFICKDKDPQDITYELSGGGMVASAASFDIPNKSVFCVLVVTGASNLSRDLDPISNSFDYLRDDGAGTFAQFRADVAGSNSIMKFERIEARANLFVLSKYAKSVRVNLNPFCDGTISFYKEMEV